MPVRKIEAVVSVKTQGSGELVKLTKQFNELGGKTALKTVKAFQKVTRETKVLQGSLQKASPEVVRLTKKFNDLGGKAAVNTARSVKKLERDIKSLTPTVKKSTTVWTKFTQGIAIGNIAAQAAVGAFNLMKRAVSGAFRELTEATQVAARIEVLNGVMRFTGKAAGHSAQKLSDVNRELRAMGIAQRDALGIQQRFIQANLDVALATDIATVAQNAAVIAGVNSSEAAIGLTDAIVKQRPILLKQYGIITNLDKIYNQAAESLGKTRAELTTTEKRMGFFNEIMKQASTITGAYTTAMGFAGKRMTSLPRHFEDVQQAIGRHFLPAFNLAIDVTEGFLKAITATFGDGTDLAIMNLLKLTKSQEKFGESSSKILEMADRYDTLQAMTSLTTREQGELNVLLEDLAKMQPGIITNWDSMGRALEVNTKALRSAIGAQGDFNILANKDALRAIGDAYRENAVEIADLEAHLKNVLKPQQEFYNFSSIMRRKATDEIKDNSKAVAALAFQQEELAAEARKAFPDLIEGTKQYAFAVSTVGEELANTSTASVILAEQEAQRATAAQRLWQDMQKRALEFNDEVMMAEEERVKQAILDSELWGLKWSAILNRALEDDEDFHDDSSKSDARDYMIRLRRLKEWQVEFKAAKREEERIAKEHSGRMALVGGLGFEASLIGLDEFHVAVKEANLAHNERMIELQEGNILTRAEFNQGRLASEALLQEELSFIQIDAVESTAQAYEDRWMFATEATSDAFGELARIAVTDTKHIGDEMTAVFEDIGRSIVVNMAKKAVDALQKYIFKAIAAKAVTKLLGNEQENLGDKTKTLADISGNLAGQTLNVATQTILAVTAMKAEGIAVKALITHYVSLAAAKSAANPLSAPGRIAAATLVQTSLTKLLTPKGFDDPKNDETAFRHGQDYARNFMRGTNKEWEAPGFGQTVRRNIPIDSGANYARDNGYLSEGGLGTPQAPSIEINIHGNVYSNEEFMQMVRDVQDGNFAGFIPSGVFMRGGW